MPGIVATSILRGKEERWAEIDQGGVDLGRLREKGMLVCIWAHL